MDDLDRLNDRLVANVRGGFPHLLDRAFQLGDVSEHLVPYRLNRRELGFDSVRQYELALMRLASGERGYLRAEAGVQDAFRRALTAPEPDAALLRDHARASVALAVDGSATPPVQFAPAPAPEPEPPGATAEVPPAAVPTLSGIPTGIGFETPAWATEIPATLPEPPVPSIEMPVVAPVFPTPTPERRMGTAAPVEPLPGPTTMGGPCRYCGHTLPDGRPVTFCPNCGQNVTVRLCPACSTELEVGWRFCITCGRAMDESALANPPR